MERLGTARYLNPYFGLHRPRDFAKKAAEYFGREFGIPAAEVKKAAAAAAAQNAVENRRAVCYDEGKYEKGATDHV